MFHLSSSLFLSNLSSLTPAELFPMNPPSPLSLSEQSITALRDVNGEHQLEGSPEAGGSTGFSLRTPPRRASQRGSTERSRSFAERTHWV